MDPIKLFLGFYISFAFSLCLLPPGASPKTKRVLASFYSDSSFFCHPQNFLQKQKKQNTF